jgi:hypothetical protein
MKITHEPLKFKHVLASEKSPRYGRPKENLQPASLVKVVKDSNNTDKADKADKAMRDNRVEEQVQDFDNPSSSHDSKEISKQTLLPNSSLPLA